LTRFGGSFCFPAAVIVVCGLFAVLRYYHIHDDNPVGLATTWLTSPPRMCSIRLSNGNSATRLTYELKGD